MNTTRTRLLALALTAAALGGLSTACANEGGSTRAPKHPDATVSASKDASAGKSVDPSSEEDDSTITVALTGTAKWRDGVKASLSGFSRGVSSDTAYPSGEPYLRFKVTVDNGSREPLDLSMVNLVCPNGADQVSDYDQGLNGSANGHVIAGETRSWVTACSFPKAGKKVQIEVTPYTDDPDHYYRTAIFRGTVK